MLEDFDKNYKLIEINTKKLKDICINYPGEDFSHLTYDMDNYDEYSIRFAVLHIPTHQYIATAQVIPAACVPKDVPLTIQHSPTNILTSCIQNDPSIENKIAEIRALGIQRGFRTRIAILTIIRGILEICASYGIQAAVMSVHNRTAHLVGSIGLSLIRLDKSIDEHTINGIYLCLISESLSCMQKNKHSYWKFVTNDGEFQFETPEFIKNSSGKNKSKNQQVGLFGINESSSDNSEFTGDQGYELIRYCSRK